MTMLHVVPDERGNWRVLEEARPAALSEHRTATDAEVAALSLSARHGGAEVLVHDRYGRTRDPVRYTQPPSARARQGSRRLDEDDQMPPVGLA